MLDSQKRKEKKTNYNSSATDVNFPTAFECSIMKTPLVPGWKRKFVASLNWKRMLRQLTLQAEQRETADSSQADPPRELLLSYDPVLCFQNPFISLRDQADVATAASKFQPHDSPQAS